MGTYWSKRFPADGGAAENDVRVVILENAEKALKCRLVTNAAGQLETTIMSVCVFVLLELAFRLGQLAFAVFEMA
jgi:hypothetical protein